MATPFASKQQLELHLFPFLRLVRLMMSRMNLQPLFLQYYLFVTRVPRTIVGRVIKPQPIEHGPRDWLL
jgi:hypothetical protein